MAMSDVRSMAHVEKFSHLTIPMLWFEISLNELPERLQRRFSLYLNILPIVEKAGLYGSFLLGALLSIFAVSQVALRTSRTMASQRCHQKFNKNIVHNSIYNPCEEKKSKVAPAQVVKVNELSRSDDESNDGECLDMITRSQYELEDDDALSDIEYNETNDEGESSSNSSELVCKFLFSCRLARIFSETRFAHYFPQSFRNGDLSKGVSHTCYNRNGLIMKPKLYCRRENFVGSICIRLTVVINSGR